MLIRNYLILLIGSLLVTQQVFASKPLIHQIQYKGLSIRYVQVTNAPYVTIGWRVGVGSGTTDCEQSSLPHLAEHMIADRNDIAEYWNNVSGTDLFDSALTHHAATEYVSNFHQSKWIDGFSMMSKLMLSTGTLKQEDVDRALIDMNNEYHYRGYGWPDPSYWGVARLSNKHNYCVIEPLKQVDASEITDFIYERYSPGNINLSISGSASWEALQGIIFPILDGYLEDNIEYYKAPRYEASVLKDIASKFSPHTSIIVKLEGMTYTESKVLSISVGNALGQKFRDEAQLVYGMPVTLYFDGTDYFQIIKVPYPLGVGQVLSEMSLTIDQVVQGIIGYQHILVKTDSTPKEWVNFLLMQRDVDLSSARNIDILDPEELVGLYAEVYENAMVVDIKAQENSVWTYLYWFCMISILGILLYKLIPSKKAKK